MTYKLEEITLNIVDGVHGDCESEDNSGFYFISVKDMEGNHINYANARQISQNAYNEAHKRTKLENGDVLFANTGDTIGKMLLVTPEGVKLENTTFQKSVALLKPNLSLVTVDYFYYLIMSNRFLLKKTAVGSGQKNLLLSDMRPFLVNIIEDKLKQDEIVRYIKALDHKIIINNAINTELEKLAKTLYNYWFVQFDFPNDKGKPYRASGGKMEYSEVLKREIPKGWRVERFVDIASITTGKEDANFSTPNGKYKFFTCSKDVLLCDKPAFNGQAVLLAGNGDFNVKHYSGEFNAYQRTYVIIPKQSTFYAAMFIAASYKVSELKKGAYGSIVKFITISDVENIALPVSDKYAHLFEKLNVIISEIELLKNENDELIKLRDFLLPLLMNGQVRVR